MSIVNILRRVVARIAVGPAREVEVREPVRPCPYLICHHNQERRQP